MRYPSASLSGAASPASGGSGVRLRRAAAMVFAAARMLVIGGGPPGDRVLPYNKMTAHGGQILLVAIDLLAFLVALLRLHRQRRDRARLQPLQRDRLAGLLAIAVGVVLDALQRRVDLGDQLALAVAGAQLDRAVGFRRGAVGEVGMIDVLFLQGLQRNPGFPEDLVLPRQQLGAKIIALAVVHERLFFGGSIILQLFQGQPIFTYKAAGKKVRPRAPYIAAGCDRQYRPLGKGGTSPWPCPDNRLRSGRGGPNLVPGALVADRKTLADMGRTLDFVGECNCEVLEGNPAFAV